MSHDQFRQRDWTDLTLSLAIAVFFLLLTVPFLYRGGCGEADTVQMVIGIQQALATGRAFHEPMLYLPTGHPLFYLIFFKLGNPSWTVDQVINLVNRLSWLSMGVAIGLLFAICRRVAARPWALLATGAVACCPTVLELATAGHPVSLSLCLMLAGTLLLLRTLAGTLQVRWPAYILASALLAGAVTIRADILFFMSAPVALVFYLTRPRWHAAGLAALAVVPGVLALALSNRLIGQAGAGKPGIAGQVTGFISTYYHLSSILLGSMFLVYAIGFGMALLVACTLAWAIRRRQWAPLLCGLAIIAPTLLFFIGNPIPIRHFLHTVIGLALFIALAWQHLAPRPSKPLGFAAAIALILLTINFGLPALANASAGLLGGRASRVVTRLAFTSLDYHRQRQHYLRWDQDRWKKLLARPSHPLYIGRHLEYTGMMLALARTGARCDCENVLVGKHPALHLKVAGNEYTFLGWDESTPVHSEPGRFSTTLILAAFQPEQMAMLPKAEQYLPPAEAAYRSF